MIALPIKNEKRGFDLAYCGICLKSSVRRCSAIGVILLAARRGLPKMSDCTPICGGPSAIIGAPSAASPNFLPDGRRFCWGLLSHRRYVDECVSIRPGRKGAVFPIFSSSVASRKNLRTLSKKFWDAAMRSQQSATLRRNRIVVDKKRRYVRSFPSLAFFQRFRPGQM